MKTVFTKISTTALLSAFALVTGCSLTVDDYNFVYNSPVITSTPGDTTLEEITDSFTYAPEYEDVDTPADEAGDPGFVTCEIPENTCGDWLTFEGCNAVGTPGEEDAPGSCSYLIRVTDGVGESAEQTVELTILEGENRPPVITLDCPADVGENAPTECEIADASDPDFPADNLTCTVNVAITTCTGVSLTDCAGPLNIDAQGEAAGAGDCIVGISIEDGNGGTGTDQATIDILEENNDPEIAITCPADLDEDTAGQCTIDSVNDSDPTGDTLTCSLNTTVTTCTGVTVTDCSTAVDVAAQGESVGPGDCDVAVQVEDGNGGSATAVSVVTINEVNQDPDVELLCPANVSEGTASNCSFDTASDPDLPANTLTCSLNTSLTTCTGVIVTDCSTAVSVAAQGESAGPGSCVVAVDIDDAVGGTDTDQVSIQIDEGNDPPTISLSCPATTGEHTGVTCNATVGDTDLPAQTLTCSLDAGSTTCTGVTVSSCSSISVSPQGEAVGPGSCNVSIAVNDGNGGNTTDVQTISITEENSSPSIAISCPTDVDEDSADSCSITSATDSDPGPDTLTCSLNGTLTTCSGVTVTNCSSAISLSAQGESSGPGSCVVAVDIDDGNGGTDTDTATVAVNEVNVAPVWTTTPSDIANIFPRDTYNQVVGVAEDTTDLPNSSAGDPGYITCSNVTDDCSFTVNVSGSGSGSASCSLSFTAPDTEETCNVTIAATDGSGGSATQTVQIGILPCVFRVADTGDNSTGRDWSTAYNHPQDAVDGAWDGCEVWVKQGIYTQAHVGLDVLTMAVGIDVYGGFNGTENSLASRGDPAMNQTILDGELNAYHVVTGASDTILDAIEMRNGSARDTGAGSVHGMGGGLLINGASNMEVTRCVFYQNQAYEYGGGFNVYNSSNILFQGCIFDGNVVTRSGVWPPGSGGGGYVYNSTAAFVDSVFTGNSCNTMGAGLHLGGGSASVQVRNCLFEQNTVGSTGGIISAYYASSITIQNVTIANNTGGIGSALTTYDTNVSISDSILWGNTGSSPIYSTGGSVSISYSNVPGGFPGGSNLIDVNPMFQTHAMGDYFLDQINSQCVDAGSMTSVSAGLDTYTTSTGMTPDTGTVDMGYHYRTGP